MEIIGTKIAKHNTKRTYIKSLGIVRLHNFIVEPLKPSKIKCQIIQS
jgi:hypothetical protein